MAPVRILRRKHQAAQQLSRHREPALMRDQPEQVGADIAAAELADLRQQVAQLRDAVRARDDFIAIAAHELRNPMTPIMGVAELALKAARDAESACPPRVTTLLERMQLLAQDFIQRSTRLLDVSRIEAGNLQLRPSETDLSALVLSVTQKYDITATHRRSPIELDIKGGITGILDRLAVEQVVENLLSNALKFGAGEPVTVRLRSDGRSAQLDVQDRGIGMSPDQQARVFGRFEQVIAQHRGPGFGVGLWLANCLVAAMNGQIAVSSDIGKGSTFTVTLPLAPPGPDRTTHDAA
jgi:two-component system, OmpR family, sensor kinase